MKIIDAAKLRPGLIMQARVNSWFGRTTVKCLTRWIRREIGDRAPEAWGSHTALTVDICGDIYIGDSAPPFARATTIKDWNHKILLGNAEVRFFEVIGATPEQERAASAWWLLNVQGKVYDYMAFPRLWIKSMVKSFWPKAFGWEWAWFCSEGVGRAWAAATESAIGPFGKAQATPLTVEKRAGLYGDKPTLREVTGQVMTDSSDFIARLKAVLDIAARPTIGCPGAMTLTALLFVIIAAAGCSSTRIQGSSQDQAGPALAETNSPPAIVITLSGIFWRSAIVVGSAGTNDNQVNGGGKPTLSVPLTP